MKILVTKNQHDEIVIKMQDIAGQEENFDYIKFLDYLLAKRQDIEVTSDGCMNEDATKELEKMATAIKEKVDAARTRISVIGETPAPDEDDKKAGDDFYFGDEDEEDEYLQPDHGY